MGEKSREQEIGATGSEILDTYPIYKGMLVSAFMQEMGKKKQIFWDQVDDIGYAHAECFVNGLEAMVLGLMEKIGKLTIREAKFQLKALRESDFSDALGMISQDSGGTMSREEESSIRMEYGNFKN